MPRVQTMVVRDGRVLMVKHREGGEDYWCLPGGALEPGETPEQGAVRELREECGVEGVVLRPTAHSLEVYAGETHSFLVDIGDQRPTLGYDPEISAGMRVPLLIDVRWLRLREIPERDRAFLWAAGLLGVRAFATEVEGWSDDVSYPGAGYGDRTVAGDAGQHASVVPSGDEARGETPRNRGRSARDGPVLDVYALLDEVRTVARNGLRFATDPYDQERYERLMTLATQSYSALLSIPEEAVRARLWNEMGYITPKVGADAAIFNEQGEILLMERADSGAWCLPCGWVEPNERPIDTIVREAREETGLEVAVGPLVGVFTRMPSGAYGPHTMIAIVHLCRVIGGDLTLSHEGTDLRYWPIGEVRNWAANHERYARAAYKMWRSDMSVSAVSD